MILNLMVHSSIFQNHFPDFKNARVETLQLLDIHASTLEKTTKVTDGVNLGGSVTGIVGGILTIVGVGLIPVTFGASLGLTIAGVSVGVAGGATSVGSVIADITVNRRVKREKDTILQNDIEVTQKLRPSLTSLENISKQIAELFGDQQSAIPPEFLHSFRTYADLLQCVFKDMREFDPNLFRALGAAIGVAEAAANTGKAGTRGVAAGISAAAGASIGLAAAGMLLDIGMVGYLSYRIHNGSKSELAEHIREIISAFKFQTDVLQQFYDCTKPSKPRSPSKSPPIPSPQSQVAETWTTLAACSITHASVQTTDFGRLR